MELILEKVAVKFVAGMTNLVGNSLFSLIVLWSLMRGFGYGIALVASNCLANSSSLTDKSNFTFSSNKFAFSYIAKLSGVAQGQPPSGDGQIPTVYNLRF